MQVYVAAFRKRKLSHPNDPAELYEIDDDNEAEFLPHGRTFRFLAKL